MSVTAKFSADFSSFQSAVANAQTKLADFSRGAGNVESSLNKMVSSFSGTKIIQDAAKMTEAIERIGGPTKLTATELAHVSAKAGEAAAKMKAMGMDVPPALQKIADYLDQLEMGRTWGHETPRL